MTKNILDPFKIGKSHTLNKCHVFPLEAAHVFDERQAVALLAARAIHRPLLVQGEPGCGKTQLARAAAQIFSMPLASLVVNERTEVEDLLYSYDALRRLSDANDPGEKVNEERKYLSPGPLWWAIDHESVENIWAGNEWRGKERHKPYSGEGKDLRQYSNGVLLLIDEIDKADRSVPNALLEALGNYSFPVPWLNKRIEIGNGEPPLIVITTNEEQELPPAFVRRCLVLTMNLPIDENDFVEDLTNKGKGRFKDIKAIPFEDIATQLWQKRLEAKNNHQRFVPGQAEYFDHIEAYIKLRKGLELTDEKLREELSQLTYQKGR